MYYISFAGVWAMTSITTQISSRQVITRPSCSARVPVGSVTMVSWPSHQPKHKGYLTWPTWCTMYLLTCCRCVLSWNVSQGQHIVLSQDLGWRWCCYPYQTPSFCLHDSSRNRYVCARVTHVIHCSVLNSTMLGQNLVPTISLLPSLVLNTCISCIAGKHQLSIGGDLYSIDLLAGDTSTHCYAHPTQVQNCKTLCEKQPEVCALCTTLFAWLLPSLFVLIACTILVVLSQLTAPIETCLSIHFIGTAHSKAAEWMSGQGPE